MEETDNKSLAIESFDSSEVLFDHLESPDDPKTMEVLPLSPSLMYIENDRNAAAWAEYIDAYIEAMETIAEHAYHSTENYVGLFRALIYPTMPIPLLHLCRHTVELTLKSINISKGEKICTRHDLNYIWEKSHDEIERALGEEKTRGAHRLVAFLDGIDEKGTRFRYASDGKPEGTQSIENHAWVNARKLVGYTKLIVNLLRSEGVIPTAHASEYKIASAPELTAFMKDLSDKP